jgi:hypothetical protein
VPSGIAVPPVARPTRRRIAGVERRLLEVEGLREPDAARDPADPCQAEEGFLAISRMVSPQGLAPFQRWAFFFSTFGQRTAEPVVASGGMVFRGEHLDFP